MAFTTQPSNETRGKHNPIQSRISSIQVLRGIAAIIVTIYHSKDLIGQDDPFKKEIDFLFNSGPAGVPLFFVISGFIMVYITRESASTPLGIYRFIVKRFLRIWPAYATITLLFHFIQYRFSTDPHVLSGLVQSLFFIPISPLDPPFYGAATLSVGWTLNYEIYFYVLVAFSLFFLKYRWHIFFALIGLTLIVIPISFEYLTLKPDRAPDFGIRYLNMITNPIIWNFAYGVGIGLIYDNPVLSAWFSSLFSRKSISITVFILVIWQYLSGFFGGFGPVQWGLGAVSLFTAFLFYNEHRSIPFPGWLIRLGDISFSVYLLHIPVLVALALFFRKIGYPAYGSGIAMFFLSVSTTLVVSDLSYKYLELGLSNRLKSLFPYMKPRENRAKINTDS